VTAELSFDEWLSQTQARRDELAEYARSPMPIGNDSNGELNALIVAEDDAQRLLVDAESYLLQAQSMAMFSARNDHPELSAKERELVAKSDVRHIQRLVDGIAVTARTISSRRFLQMNQARSR
jgi:hypothetical protein